MLRERRLFSEGCRKMKLKAVSGIMLTLLMASIVIVLASPIPVIAQANSTTTVYLDPPTINGTAIGQEFNVSIMIRDAQDIYAWQAGLTFNATLLECTGFFEGEFLEEHAGPMGTGCIKGTINNTAGMIFPPYGCYFFGHYNASGDGRLAYATFKVKAPGVSDVHLLCVKVLDYPGLNLVPVNIIDVYTVVLDTTSHTVVTVSNSTDTVGGVISGLYGHAFSIPAEKISFKVRGPHPGFCNVTIPKTLLNVSTLDEWRVKIDGKLLSTGERTIVENATHYSIYFTYSAGFHYVQITTRSLINSIISIALSSTTITLGSSVTIIGAIDPLRPSVTATILYRLSGGTLATLTTDPSSHYNYTWTPERVGTYEFMAMWEGDDDTFGDVSDVQTLTVLPIYVFEVLWDDKVFHVIIESNSTVSDFYFSQPTKEIGFNVTGPDGTVGFCNVTIPSTLMWVDTLEEWLIKVDGIPLSVVERTIIYNGTHYFLYFIYTHTTHRVQIFGTHVIGPPPGYTLTIYSSPTGVTFVVDVVSRTTPWSGIYSEGASVSLVMPETHDGYVWSHWLEDGDTNRIKTVTMDTDITLTGVFTPAPPPPVGGKATPINIPTNKPEPPTLWIWLTILLPLSATTIFVKLKKKKQ